MITDNMPKSIEHPWILFDNDYDEIWDLIFALEGIIPEEEIGYDPDLDGDEEWQA